MTSLATNDSDAMIVGSTIDLGHNLGLRVVAEGVEDDRTLRWLRDQGCDLAQGYGVTRPLSAAQLAAWLARWSASGAADGPREHELSAGSRT